MSDETKAIIREAHSTIVSLAHEYDDPAQLLTQQGLDWHSLLVWLEAATEVSKDMSKFFGIVQTSLNGNFYCFLLGMAVQRELEWNPEESWVEDEDESA